MHPRRRTLAALAASLSFGTLLAAAQRNAGPARVGWLSYVADPDPALALLREGLRELGQVEGKTFVIVARFADGDFSGRNMTGITFMAMELSAKRVEVLKELVPKVTRIALLSNPEHAGELSEYRVTEETARRLGVTTTRYLVRAPQELAAAFATIRASKPDAMIVFPDSFTFARRREIAEFAAQARIPSLYGWTEFADAGGLASYGPALTENFKALSVFVDKILKGADAGKLPIEQVRRIGFTFNLVAAKALGMTVPPSMLLRADRVIE
jgi:putative tryptophan/tyrosine transport system substrate-binding protein